MMELTRESLVQIDAQIGYAASDAALDPRVSVRLITALEAFRERSQQIIDALPTMSRQQLHESIAELERLGAHARAAAAADRDARRRTRQRVETAHHWVKRLKDKAIDRPAASPAR